MRLPDYTLVSEIEGRFTYSLRPADRTRVYGQITASVTAATESNRDSQEVPGTPWLRVEMSPHQLPDNTREPLPCPDPLIVNGRLIPHSYCYVSLHRSGTANPITVLGSTGHPRTSFPNVGLTDAAKRTLGHFFGILASELMTNVRAAGALYDDAQERLVFKIDEYDRIATALRSEIDALATARDECASILADALSAESKTG